CSSIAPSSSLSSRARSFWLYSPRLVTACCRVSAGSPLAWAGRSLSAQLAALRPIAMIPTNRRILCCMGILPGSARHGRGTENTTIDNRSQLLMHLNAARVREGSAGGQPPQTGNVLGSGTEQLLCIAHRLLQAEGAGCQTEGRLDTSVIQLLIALTQAARQGNDRDAGRGGDSRDAHRGLAMQGLDRKSV